MSRAAFIFLVMLMAGVGLYTVPRLYAAPGTDVYPPDKNILTDRSFEPADLAVNNGGTITVTINVTNNEDVALRGFYYSDQVPNGWAVNTAGVSVDGTPVADYTYGQGYADEVYGGFKPHRWTLEIPQADGTFSPFCPIPASGGTAQIIYTMIVSGGTGSDYAIGHEAWAGWLESEPMGTAVFGYQSITVTAPLPTSTATPTSPTPTATDMPTATPTPTDTPTATSAPPQADSGAAPHSEVTPSTVVLTALVVGDVDVWLWDVLYAVYLPLILKKNLR